MFEKLRNILLTPSDPSGVVRCLLPAAVVRGQPLHFDHVGEGITLPRIKLPPLYLEQRATPTLDRWAKYYSPQTNLHLSTLCKVHLRPLYRLVPLACLSFIALRSVHSMAAYCPHCQWKKLVELEEHLRLSKAS